MTSRRPSRTAPIYPPAGGVARRGRLAARGAARAAVRAQHRLAPAAVRAVRRDRAVAHRAPPRAGRRARCCAILTTGDSPRPATLPDWRGADPGARGEHRLQRPARRRRPIPGHDRGGARVRRRTSPASAPSRWARPTTSTSATPTKPHIAWQLTRIRARPRRRLPRARARRSSAATSRSTTRDLRRPDLPHARDRHGRPPARRAPRRAPRLRQRGRCDRARRPLRPVAGGARAGQAARRAAARRAARRSTSRPSAPRSSRSASAVRVGASPSAHDIAEGGLAVALAECCLARRASGARRCRLAAQPDRRADPFARRCSARLPAASSSAATPDGLRRAGPAHAPRHADRQRGRGDPRDRSLRASLEL